MKRGRWPPARRSETIRRLAARIITEPAGSKQIRPLAKLIVDVLSLSGDILDRRAAHYPILTESAPLSFLRAPMPPVKSIKKK